MLTELDARIGDGDHGINLARGMTAVRDQLGGVAAAPAADEALRITGRTIVSSVGGASGPLYGTLFLDAAAAIDGASESALAHGLRSGVAGVARRGRSTVGQKTMLDALVPATDALAAGVAAGATLAAATRAAADAARTGSEATRSMVAQRGRASYLGERAVGHLDPGAVSSRIIIEALAECAAQADRPPLATRR